MEFGIGRSSRELLILGIVLLFVLQICLHNRLLNHVLAYFRIIIMPITNVFVYFVVIITRTLHGKKEFKSSIKGILL